MKKYKSILVSLVLFVLFIGCINKTSEESKQYSIASSDSIVLPCLFKERGRKKTYLKDVSLADRRSQFIQNMLSYNYLKDSIGANDIFLEYTFRDESIYKSDSTITERSYISRYVPTGDKEFTVSTILTLINRIKPQGCTEINLKWNDKGLLSSKDNDTERYVFDVYQQIKN